jgi:retron-type reverse transcriptase
MKICKNIFIKVIEPETLFSAWEEFRRGKSKKPDVLSFEEDLEANIFKLARDLSSKRYSHEGYTGFYICDPKLRHIHKASVRDRVLHHAITTVLNPIFEPTLIPNSFSCRVGKGTHKGLDALRTMLRKVSKNNTRQCYVLKCDVRKFFDSIDHDILLSILRRRIEDSDMMLLLENIIESYSGTQSDLFNRKGVPIGNLTSQLFANVYMNEFDQFMKHILKVEHYARYTDDFVIVSSEKEYLAGLIAPIDTFLRETLKISLHPNKVTIGPYHRGVDFLGYVIFPRYTLIRKRTKKRIKRKFEGKVRDFREGLIEKEKIESTLQSYLGILSHANTHRFKEQLKNYSWFMLSE